MAVKPDWLRKLEEEQAANLSLQEEAVELNASHQRILNEGALKLWNRIVARLHDAVETCEIKGISLVRETPSAHLMTIQVLRPNSAGQAAMMDVQFFPESYEIKTSFRGPRGMHTPTVLRFTVSGGRVSLSEGANALPDNGEDVAEVACQRLLEPLLSSFI